MNTTQAITKDTFLPNTQLFTGSPGLTKYLWSNLIIEKQVSVSWIYKLYRRSVIHDFWTILTS